jgi:hypothetical protein
MGLNGLHSFLFGIAIPLGVSASVTTFSLRESSFIILGRQGVSSKA